MTLAEDGDEREKRCLALFLARDFPSYERFWGLHVLPITGRPKTIEILDDAQLPKDRTAEDVKIAQLHYTVLCHLESAWAVKDELHSVQAAIPHGLVGHQMAQMARLPGSSRVAPAFDRFSAGVGNLVSAQDVASELLERRQDLDRTRAAAAKPTYPAWKFDRRNDPKRVWLDRERPLPRFKDVAMLRAYRNHLVHGTVMPYFFAEGGAIVLVPKIGAEDQYADWRLARHIVLGQPDFGTLGEVFDAAWNVTVAYLEAAWKAILPSPA